MFADYQRLCGLLGVCERGQAAAAEARQAVQPTSQPAGALPAPGLGGISQRPRPSHRARALTGRRVSSVDGVGNGNRGSAPTSSQRALPPAPMPTPVEGSAAAEAETLSRQVAALSAHTAAMMRASRA